MTDKAAKNNRPQTAMKAFKTNVCLDTCDRNKNNGIAQDINQISISSRGIFSEMRWVEQTEPQFDIAKGAAVVGSGLGCLQPLCTHDLRAQTAGAKAGESI